MRKTKSEMDDSDRHAAHAAPRFAVPLGRGLLVLGIVALLVLPTICVAAGATDLPPRPAPVPTPVPDAPEATRGESGGYIRLVVMEPETGAATDGLWTVVQWEDAAGVWHDVDGWCGALDDAGGGAKTWWVSANDLDRGPFRWAVRESPAGPMVAVSDPFLLPAAPREVTEVSVARP